MNDPLNFGIVGTGLIANIIAKAINMVDGAKLTAVAGRRIQAIEEFARQHEVPKRYDRWEQMVTDEMVDVVYVATPTSVREEIAVAAARHKKHVLADKPFASLASVRRIIDETRQAGVAFMDATHFVHHPRTKRIQAKIKEMIGPVQAVRSCFFFPFMDRTNIRFNPQKEPTGAVGDMAWYCMRAITEYMQDRAELQSLSASAERDHETGAAIRGAGVAIFKDGKTSTFDFGYNAGVCLMDLDLLGTGGMVRMDDFVLDWASGFAFDNPEFEVGYTLRKEMMTPDQFDFMHVINPVPQTVHMIQDFVELAQDPAGAAAERSCEITLQTQALLDRVWEAVN